MSPKEAATLRPGDGIEYRWRRWTRQARVECVSTSAERVKVSYLKSSIDGVTSHWIESARIVLVRRRT